MDADIIVHPRLAFPLKAFADGCKSGGMEILAIDLESTAPFPGRPQGQDRLQVKCVSGEIIDLFFPKGFLKS